MKLAVFGCSWSFGVMKDWSLKISSPEQKIRIPNDDFTCWPRELGKLKPDWQITNYSLPGASIFYCASMLERALDQNYDLYIFQATTPYRFTYWTDHLVPTRKFKNYEPNVLMSTYENLVNIKIVNVHEAENNVYAPNLSPKENEIETDFVRKYFQRVSNDMFESEYRILCDWAKSKSHIFFSHLDYDFLNCPSVQNSLGEKFDEFVCDEGSHFGKKGARWQANWILNQINTL